MVGRSSAAGTPNMNYSRPLYTGGQVSFARAVNNKSSFRFRPYPSQLFHYIHHALALSPVLPYTHTHTYPIRHELYCTVPECARANTYPFRNFDSNLFHNRVDEMCLLRFVATLLCSWMYSVCVLLLNVSKFSNILYVCKLKRE